MARRHIYIIYGIEQLGFDPVETEMTFNRNEYEDIFTAAAA